MVKKYQRTGIFDVKLDGQETPKNGYFRYDRSIIHKDWEDEDVSHRIRVV
jgi:hypothetical protein